MNYIRTLKDETLNIPVRLTKLSPDGLANVYGVGLEATWNPLSLAEHRIKNQSQGSRA